MSNFILRQKPEGQKSGILRWDAVLEPFGDRVRVLDRSGDVMLLVEAEEAVVQEIVDKNEGVQYFAEVIHELPGHGRGSSLVKESGKVQSASAAGRKSEQASVALNEVEGADELVSGVLKNLYDL